MRTTKTVFVWGALSAFSFMAGFGCGESDISVAKPDASVAPAVEGSTAPAKSSTKPAKAERAGNTSGNRNPGASS